VGHFENCNIPLLAEALLSKIAEIVDSAFGPSSKEGPERSPMIMAKNDTQPILTNFKVAHYPKFQNELPGQRAVLPDGCSRLRVRFEISGF